MLVSAVMPVYNDEKYVEAAVLSLINQTHKIDEIVIVVDGSTDNSLMIIERLVERFDNQRFVLIVQKNMGVASALVSGIKIARNEIIMRMDADDICEPERLKIQLSYLKGGYDIVGSNIELFGDKKGLVLYPENNSDIRLAMLMRCALAHPSIVAYKKHLNYQIEIREDYNLWLRICQKDTVKFYNVQHPLLKYRVRTGQQSQKDRQSQSKKIQKNKVIRLTRSKTVTSFVWRHILKDVIRGKIGFYHALFLVKNFDFFCWEFVIWISQKRN